MVGNVWSNYIIQDAESNYSPRGPTREKRQRNRSRKGWRETVAEEAHRPTTSEMK